MKLKNKPEGSKRTQNSHLATLKMMSIKFNLDNQDTQTYLPDNARLPTLQNVFIVDIHGLTLWEVNALLKANSVATVPNIMILLVYADHEEKKDLEDSANAIHV